MPKSKAAVQVAQVEAPEPTLTPLALAAKAIAGKTQEEILALYGAGQLDAYGDANLWRAYMNRVAARQDRKAKAVE